MTVNVWSLPKARPLKHLLLTLHERLGLASFALLDQRDDFRALTLCKSDFPELRAYIYIYGQMGGRFGLHLEYPPQGGYLSAPDIHEGLTMETLVEVLSMHFDLVS